MSSTVQGKWNITIKTPMGERIGVLELGVDGAGLTGTMSHADHSVAISNGRINGNQLSWSATITKPMRLNFKFTATVEGNRISGTARNCWATRLLRARALKGRLSAANCAIALN